MWRQSQCISTLAKYSDQPVGHQPPQIPSLPHCSVYGLVRLFIQSECSAKVCHLQGVGVALALFRSLPGLLRDAVDQVAKPAGERRTCVDSHFAKEKGTNPSAGTKSRCNTNNKACCHQNHLQAKNKQLVISCAGEYHSEVSVGIFNTKP